MTATLVSKGGTIVSWTDGRLLIDYDNPPRKGFVYSVYRKEDTPVRGDGYVQFFVGWFPKRTPRLRNLNTLTREYFERLEEMKRVQTETQKGKGKWTPSKDQFLKGRPTIDAFLTDAWWDDGKPRDVCSLTVRIGFECAMVSLNDSENEQSITTNGKDVDDALDRLEAYIAPGNASWRPWGKKRK